MQAYTCGGAARSRGGGVCVCVRVCVCACVRVVCVSLNATGRSIPTQHPTRSREQSKSAAVGDAAWLCVGICSTRFVETDNGSSQNIRDTSNLFCTTCQEVPGCELVLAPSRDERRIRQRNFRCGCRYPSPRHSPPVCSTIPLLGCVDVFTVLCPQVGRCGFHPTP